MRQRYPIGRMAFKAGLLGLLPLLGNGSLQPTSAQDSRVAPPAISNTVVPLTAGVVASQYNGLRIADVAPEIILPAESAAGKLWSSHDQLAQHAILMVVVSSRPAPAVGTRVALMNSLERAARPLHNSDIIPVLVFSGNSAIKMERAANSALVVLHDDKGDLEKLLGPTPTGLTLVAIDKAGFLRHIEPVQDPALAGPRMQQISDPTPRLEVGKVAPDFAVLDMHGRLHRLADLRGQKNMLLTFFPKCFTGG
ncbi:MAG: hypothetical protein JO316_12655 [Abitibacteriaceae bacterium]|nr:hypothetical protein [Abditibacteriaceae bacterium]